MLTGVWHLDYDCDMVTGICYNHDPNFGSLSWFWRCKEHPCPLSPHLGLWRMLEVPYWGLASWYWFGYNHWSLINPWYEVWLYTFILKVQRTTISIKSWFWAMVGAGGIWLEFGILILIFLWSLVFYTPMIWIWISILILKVQRTSKSFNSWLGALVGAWEFLKGV